MKIFEYDICDGDKGIIIAETEERAFEIFKEEYPDVNTDEYWEDGGAIINHITNFNGEEKLICTWNA